MKGPARRIVVECRCGMILPPVLVTPAMTNDEARQILDRPCPLCGNTGSGRIYTILPVRPLRIVR